MHLFREDEVKITFDPKMKFLNKTKMQRTTNQSVNEVNLPILLIVVGWTDDDDCVDDGFDVVLLYVIVLLFVSIIEGAAVVDVVIFSCVSLTPTGLNVGNFS